MGTAPLYVAFDLETTGLNVVTDNIVTATVVGLSGVDVDLLLTPTVPISAEAQAVHGITNEYAAEHGMDYAEGLTKLGDALTAAWDAGAVIVGHNISGMDLPMIRMQERRVFGSPRTKLGPFLDTYSAYKKAFPDRRHRLVDACEHLGILLDNAHDAHADAEASRDLAYILYAMSQEGTAA